MAASDEVDVVLNQSNTHSEKVIQHKTEFTCSKTLSARTSYYKFIYLFIYKSFDTVTTQPEPSVSVM